MDDWFRWIVGILLTVTLALVGYMINAMKDLRRKGSEDTGGLHKRVDEIHRDYVRRDDFRDYKVENRETLSRIEEKLDKALHLPRTG